MKTKSTPLLIMFYFTTALLVSCKENKTSNKSQSVKSFQSEANPNTKTSQKSNKNQVVYESDSVILTGRLKIQKFYGPPGYGEDPKNDRIEEEYILNLDKPVDVKDSPKVSDSGITNINELELVILDYTKVNSLVNKRITLKGTLYDAESGHDHTPVLMQVGQVVESKN